MICYLCGGKNYILRAERTRDSQHRVLECKNCGLLQLFPRPSMSSEKKFYDDDCQAKNIKLPKSIKLLERLCLTDVKRRVDLVTKHFQRNDKLLDIGSGYGFFLKAMSKRGYNIRGIEISKARRRISKKVSSANVLNENLLENKTQGMTVFDGVTAFHVLEHISDPVGYLKKLKRWVKDKGKLIIEVPNVEDMLLKCCPSYQAFYWQRAHLFYFNAQTLSRVIKKAGLVITKILYVQRYGIENFMHWFILGKPQIKGPSFQTKTDYKWLEAYYKKHLIKKEKSDTLILIAKN